MQHGLAFKLRFQLKPQFYKSNSKELELYNYLNLTTSHNYPLTTNTQSVCGKSFVYNLRVAKEDQVDLIVAEQDTPEITEVMCSPCCCDHKSKAHQTHHSNNNSKPSSNKVTPKFKSKVISKTKSLDEEQLSVLKEQLLAEFLKKKQQEQTSESTSSSKPIISDIQQPKSQYPNQQQTPTQIPKQTPSKTSIQTPTPTQTKSKTLSQIPTQTPNSLLDLTNSSTTNQHIDTSKLSVTDINGIKNPGKNPVVLPTLNFNEFDTNPLVTDLELDLEVQQLLTTVSKDKVELLKARCFDKLYNLFGIYKEKFKDTKIKQPKLSFNLKSRTIAGQARYPDVIELNLKFLIQEGNHFIDNVVGHEFAHYLVFYMMANKMLPRNVKPHGKEWKSFMHLFNIEPNVYHSYDVEQRVKRQYRYVCSCKEHFLTAIRHNRIKKGFKYSCTKCHEVLRFEPIERAKSQVQDDE